MNKREKILFSIYLCAIIGGGFIAGLLIIGSVNEDTYNAVDISSTITVPYVIAEGNFDVIDIYEYAELPSYGHGAEYVHHIAHISIDGYRYNVTNMIDYGRMENTFSQLRIYIIQNGTYIQPQQINIDWGEVYTFSMCYIEFEIYMNL